MWGGLMHAYHGFRLFFYELRLSAKYLLKMRKGTLTRKEWEQVQSKKFVQCELNY